MVRFVTLPELAVRDDPISKLLMLRHQSLPELEVIEMGPSRWALISEGGETTLANRLKECQTAGQPGLDREELLEWLGCAADALDQLYHLHQLQHLTLNPRQLALCNGQLILHEFGLAELIWLPSGQQLANLNPRYAAVELFDGLISDACDQFSLALIYQELLVGLHPYRNMNARQLASPKLRGSPDLSLLPGPDRAIVAQALAPEPERRFRSCREFILALEEGSQSNVGTVIFPTGITRSMPVGQQGQPQPTPAPIPIGPPDWLAAINELVEAAAHGHQIRSSGLVHYRLTPGREIEHHAWARLIPKMARLKLDAFREQWQAEIVEKQENRFVLDIRPPSNIWQRCLGQLPGLIMEITFGAVLDNEAQFTPIRTRLEAVDCSRGKAEQLLAESGPVLLCSLQSYMHSQCDQKSQERYPLNQTIFIQTTSGLSLNAQVYDIGREEMTILSTIALPAGSIKLTINRWASPLTVEVPGRVRGSVAMADNKFLVELALG
jgi:hypothetical protein